MDNKISDIVTRILSGESSPHEDIDLINWLDNHPERINEFADKEKVWNAINLVFAKERFNDRAAYVKFCNKIGQSNSKILHLKNTTGQLTRILRWVAVGIILLGFGSLIIYHIVGKTDSLFQAEHYKIIVPAGSRSNLILTDGTSVWLNADSRLSYSDKFGDSDRTVNLEGEGYFEVEKDSQFPFTVVTSEFEIVALGTSFNVKSYPEEDIVQTTLVSGSLLINRTKHKSGEHGLTLEPNQQLTYFRNTSRLELLSHKEDIDIKTDKPGTGKIKRLDENELPRAVLSKGVDPEIFTSWKSNKLILDDEPFESIAVKLERRFGTKIIIKDEEIRKRRFKGRFEEVTMEQALNALQFTSPFDYFINNDTIYIQNK